MEKVELLAPVGNREMLYQAIHNGADAVYLAGFKYGARKFAKNFSEEELVEVIGYAHLYGVKVYVTVNVLIYENELEDVLSYLEFLHVHGVDAVIMQDMGLIWYVRKLLPHLEIHASTQCHNHNQEIVLLWKELGLTRVVFAREMSLEEIQSVDVPIEKEVFVYGALCVCYSGCCLFSSLNGGRSGNRGECVGSCRLPYRLIRGNQKMDIDGEYLLSTKELNTMNKVGSLIKAGITSFKIEGRMKSPAYVGYVTRLYRKLIDCYYRQEETKLSAIELQNLKKLFHREFTCGYLFSDPDIMNIHSPNHLGIEIGRVLEVDSKKIKIKLNFDSLCQNDGIRFKNNGQGMIVNRLYDQNKLLIQQVDKGEICFLDNKFGVEKGDILLKTVDSKLIRELERYSLKKIPVWMKVKCFLGKEMELKLTDGIHTVFKRYGQVESAIKREVDTSEIQRQFEKLGNTPFVLENIEIQSDPHIFINLKDMNELRRRAVEQLILIRKNQKKKVVKDVVLDRFVNLETDHNIYLNVLVRTEEQLKCCLANAVHDIYVTDYALYLKYKNLGNVYYRMDRVNSSYLDYSQEKLVVGELGSVHRYSKNNIVIGDYYLNVTNHHSIEFLSELGVRKVTLSVELNDCQIRDIMKKSYPVELIIYGRLELMVMKYCPLKKCLKYCDKCLNSQEKFYLEDQAGRRYPMIRKNCLTHIMHFENMNRISKIQDYQKMGIQHFRIEFFEEDALEVEQVISRIKKQLKHQ